jgi:hypothetical protein
VRQSASGFLLLKRRQVRSQGALLFQRLFSFEAFLLTPLYLSLQWISWSLPLPAPFTMECKEPSSQRFLLVK